MSPGQNGCLCDLDPSVAYDGPRAAIATLGGSPTWGLGDRFHELAASRATPGSASIARGRPTGSARRSSTTGRRPAASSSASRPTARSSTRTRCSAPASGRRSGSSGGRACGSSWSAAPAGAATGGERRATRTRSGPGDFVLPRSYLPRDTMPTGLPGTELEFCLARQVAIMDDPFCPPLAEAIREEAHARPGVPLPARPRPRDGRRPQPLARRQRLRVARDLPRARGLRRLTGMPVITGDCVSPVLARVCGMHLGYYHVVANWGTGLEPEDPTITLDRLYLETLPRSRPRSSSRCSTVCASRPRAAAARSCGRGPRSTRGPSLPRREGAPARPPPPLLRHGPGGRLLPPRPLARDRARGAHAPARDHGGGRGPHARRPRPAGRRRPRHHPPRRGRLLVHVGGRAPRAATTRRGSAARSARRRARPSSARCDAVRDELGRLGVAIGGRGHPVSRRA